MSGDKTNTEMLVNGGEMLWHNLHAMLVTCWEEEFVSEEWTEGIIVPLYKEGMRVMLGTIEG